MKLTLTIEGDASALARVLAALDANQVPIMPEVAAAMTTSAPAAAVNAVPPQAIGGAVPLPPMPIAPTVPEQAVTTAIPASVPASVAPDEDDGPADANAPDTDVNGLPWDERIHAKSKALNADKSWRSRRNLDAATKATVEAELRHTVPAPAPVAPAAPAPVALPATDVVPAMVPPMPPPAPIAAVPPPPYVAVAPPAPLQAPVAAAVVASAPPAGPLDFAGFMQQLQVKFAERDANGAPKLDPVYMEELTKRINQAAQVNMAAITDLGNYPHLVDYTVQVMTHDGRW